MTVSDLISGSQMEITPKGKRRCSHCQQLKRVSDFLRNGASVNTKVCNACNKEKRAVWRASETGRVSAARSKRSWGCRQYGITTAQYAMLLEVQGGVCAICRTNPENGKSLGVDHCHETGKVRALLCVTCNVHLGTYETFREKAEKFLRDFGGGNPLLYGEDSDHSS